MARVHSSLSEPDLELALLRKGVHALAAGRHHCADCARTPLVGERMYVYASGATVCALCHPLHHGQPVHSQLVHHSEHDITVRRLRAA
jgi:hypothetical protein